MWSSTRTWTMEVAAIARSLLNSMRYIVSHRSMPCIAHPVAGRGGKHAVAHLPAAATAALRSSHGYRRCRRVRNCHRGVAGFLDGMAQLRGVGLGRLNGDAVRRQVDAHLCVLVRGLDGFGDGADAVAAGHVVDFEGDHGFGAESRRGAYCRPSYRGKVKAGPRLTLYVKGSRPQRD